MWIMTHFGILMPSLRPADTVLPGDDRLIQIRARRARDLNYLREHYAPYLGATLFLGDTDYQYRAYCTHRELADVVSQLALEIDYTNFKPTTDRHNDEQLHRLYLRIWNAVFAAFPSGSSYDRQVEQVPSGGGRKTRSQRRRDRRSRRRSGTGWQNAFVEVDEDDVSLGGRNEYADGNRRFRRYWWEDVDDVR